ncbi:hypothetical protein [Streptomyces sp. NPDC052179]|uniref:hypothetical protein n=1 Tax=Streptomyces sp. NPDC052179 TaxID=3155680 RepID=UPI0034306A90
MFYQASHAGFVANQQALVGGMTEAQREYLRRPPGQPPRVLDDAQSRADLDLTRSLVESVRRALLSGGIDKDLDEDNLRRVCLVPMELQFRALLDTQGLPGRQARQVFAAWLKDDAKGQQAFLMFTELLRHLRLWIGALDKQVAADAAIAAEQVQQQAAARARAAAPLSNEELLAKHSRELLGKLAPAGDKALVKAILVINGQVYRGASGSNVDAVTKELVKGLVDAMEKWTITGCAEVAALGAFVTEGGFPTVEAVRAALPAGDSHVVAMEARGPRGQVRAWVKRAPCNQCQQWLKTLRITPDTAGAYS